MRLDGKIAIVTGATGVLCSAMVESLLRAGASVALLNRREEAGKALAAELAAKGLDRTMVVTADVLDRPALERARDQVLATWGRIDILVNGAGGNNPRATVPAEQLLPETPREQSFFGLDLGGLDEVTKLNLNGTLIPSLVFGEAMTAPGGSIITISSMAATQPLTKVIGYSFAKAAIDNFTRWLSVHLAVKGIRVNAIAPGFFLTNQNRFLLLEADGVTPTARGRKVLAKTPMRRYGEAKELGGALVFLCSDEASFVTGAIIPVDGGFLAFSGV